MANVFVQSFYHNLEMMETLFHVLLRRFFSQNCLSIPDLPGTKKNFSIYIRYFFQLWRINPYHTTCKTNNTKNDSCHKFTVVLNWKIYCHKKFIWNCSYLPRFLIYTCVLLKHTYSYFMEETNCVGKKMNDLTAVCLHKSISRFHDFLGPLLLFFSQL